MSKYVLVRVQPFMKSRIEAYFRKLCRTWETCPSKNNMLNTIDASKCTYVYLPVPYKFVLCSVATSFTQFSTSLTGWYNPYNITGIMSCKTLCIILLLNNGLLVLARKPFLVSCVPLASPISYVAILRPIYPPCSYHKGIFPICKGQFCASRKISYTVHEPPLACDTVHYIFVQAMYPTSSFFLLCQPIKFHLEEEESLRRNTFYLYCATCTTYVHVLYMYMYACVYVARYMVAIAI